MMTRYFTSMPKAGHKANYLAFTTARQLRGIGTIDQKQLKV